MTRGKEVLWRLSLELALPLLVSLADEADGDDEGSRRVGFFNGVSLSFLPAS